MQVFVVPLGLEPKLFWTKTRRVANYTMGQCSPLFEDGCKFKKNIKWATKIQILFRTHAESNLLYNSPFY